jgi:hypothetical protein
MILYSSIDHHYDMFRPVITAIITQCYNTIKGRLHLKRIVTNRPLNEELERKCKAMDENLEKLCNNRNDEPDKMGQFYLRVINKPDIVSSTDEVPFKKIKFIIIV